MTDLSLYGYNEETKVPEGMVPGRIIAVHKGRYETVSPKGFGFARLKGTYQGKGEALPTVGDFVLLRHNDSGDSLIAQLLKRRTALMRSDYSGHIAGYVKTVVEQVVAANFDTVLILSSLNREHSVRRIERYLAVARQSGAQPCVVLTKADLMPDHRPAVEETKSVAGDAPVLAVSTVTGEGMDALSVYVRPGQTIVLLGSSGVGKSSLVNALAGEELMKVSAIREDDARGRHTTTHRQLIRLQSGVLVIDTPGMRELGMWNSQEGLEETFADIEAIAHRCRFGNCTHTKEPGCAIRAAIEEGNLSPDRWESYLRLSRESQMHAHMRRKQPKLRR